MPDAAELLTFAAVGDLHVREDRTSLYQELFAEISSKAEVLVLCGDLTDVDKPREAEVLAEYLRACSIPVVGVLGNHDYESDQVEEVEKILKAAGMHLLNGQSYETNGVAFVGMKGFVGGFGRRMLASFGEAVIGECNARGRQRAQSWSSITRRLSTRSKVSRWRSSRFWAYNVAFPVEKSTGRPYALIKV
jgi:Icc-related predicted phosphoesterase